MTERMQLLRLFGTIERRDDNERTIEGYCFRNADAGDGWVIPRDVMERMTADYMKFANVREMHQASAVGKAVDLIWDDAGCLMRAKIIDDQAWAKVTEGVYTGFSIGVKPVKLTRNAGKKTLVDGAWYETSLVDRPADADATFVTLSRMDEATEFEVEIDDEQCSDSEQDASRTYTKVDIERAIAAVASNHSAEMDDVIARLNEAQAQNASQVQEIERLSARVAELEAQPNPDQARPMLNVAEAIKRMAQKPSGDDVDRTALAQRRDEIMRTDWSTRPDHEKHAAMLELAEIKRAIA